MTCTIAIPVYNRVTLIHKALQSALEQQAEGLEILVVDNASTDGTWEALQAYHDPRLRLVRNDTNIGLYGNLNRCLELARGEYIRILCSDDRLVPGCIAGEVNLMQQHPSAVLLSALGRQIDAQGQVVGLLGNDFPPGLYAGEEMIGNVLWMVAHYRGNPLNLPSGILLRRAVTQQVGPFSDKYRLVGDLEYWMRMFTYGDMIITDQMGSEIMVHDGQEGQAVLMSGQVVEEYYALAAQWNAHLSRRRMETSVRQQFAAGALYLAALLRIKLKRPDVARLYWKSAKSAGLPLPTLLLATSRFAWRIQKRKRSDQLALPPLSPTPLATLPAMPVTPG